MRALITRFDPGRDQVTIHIEMQHILDLNVPNGQQDEDYHAPFLYPLILPIRLRHPGVEMHIIMESRYAISTTGDARLISKAHKWFNVLKSGIVASIENITAKETMNASDVSRDLPLAFLAPDIIEAILSGSQPSDLTVHKIKRLPALPLSWDDQRMQLGFPA